MAVGRVAAAERHLSSAVAGGFNLKRLHPCAVGLLEEAIARLLGELDCRGGSTFCECVVDVDPWIDGADLTECGI